MARPGMKWSAPLLVASIGTRVTADHVTPSLDELYTMSFDLPARRNRLSSQATNTLPAPSISAVGSGPERRLPATVCEWIRAIVVTSVQLAPPLVERNAPTAVSLALSIGTMTVPLGWTSGWPPMPA